MAGQRTIRQGKAVALAHQKSAAAEGPEIASAVVHAPLCGGLHAAFRQSDDNGLNHLVHIVFAGMRLTAHQTRLMEGEKQMPAIDEVECAEDPSGKKVE